MAGVAQSHDRDAHRYILFDFNNVRNSKPVRTGFGIDVNAHVHMRQQRHTQNVLLTVKHVGRLQIHQNKQEQSERIERIVCFD